MTKSALIFPSDAATPEETITKVLGEPKGGPNFVKPGTGGAYVRLKNGRTVGPIGGEALRLALANGGVKVSTEEKPETFQLEVGEPGTPRACMHVGKEAGGNALPGFHGTMPGPTK